MAPKEQICDAIAGGYTYGRNREILLYTLCIGTAGDGGSGTSL